MDMKEFIVALNDLEREKNIPKAQLLEAVEKALVSAYKGRNKNSEENVIVNIDPDSGKLDIWLRKYVVEEVEDPSTQVALAEVRQYDPDYQIGEAVDYPVPLENLGRIAAQTTKQVVVQTVREIERGMIFKEFSGRQGELVNGTIQRVSNDMVFVNLGRTEGIMSAGEQIRGERYLVNSRMKFYITDVRKSQKGPQVFLSRSHPGLVKRLFELEVPEIQDGIVVIESLSREAGSRTKMAVSTSDPTVDPVGACVGNRGTRVQSVVDELFGEKIDIITWTEDKEENISSALSPAKTEKIIIDENGKSATAIVPDYQLSLAIGKEGQNVRLAAKLCLIKIDIKSHTQFYGAEIETNLVGELDEEGYLNPEDFMVKPELNPEPEPAPEGLEPTAEGEPNEESSKEQDIEPSEESNIDPSTEEGEA